MHWDDAAVSPPALLKTDDEQLVVENKGAAAMGQLWGGSIQRHHYSPDGDANLYKILLLSYPIQLGIS